MLQLFFSTAAKNVNIFIIILYSFNQDYLGWLSNNRAQKEKKEKKQQQHDFLVYHIITLCYTCIPSLENLWHSYNISLFKKDELFAIFWRKRYKNNSNSLWCLKLIILLFKSFFVHTHVPTLSSFSLGNPCNWNFGIVHYNSS